METETRPGMEEQEPAPPGPAHRDRHPDPKEYVRIAIILGVITGAEVAVYYVGLSRSLFITLLIGFSILKFSLVVLWFMHLRFDDRRYSRFFLMGLALAATLYFVVLVSFRAFQS